MNPTWMQDLITLAGCLPEPRPDGAWLRVPQENLVAAARLLLDSAVRLSTITGVAAADGETELIYHYCQGGAALNLRTATQSNGMPSIAAFLPAAAWIEREIHDLYAVDFTGHPNLTRLVRPPEMPVGFYREPGGAAGKAARSA